MGEGVEEREVEKMNGLDIEFGRCQVEVRGVCKASGGSVADGILAEGCSYQNL